MAATNVAARSREEAVEAPADTSELPRVPGELGEFSKAAEKFERVEPPERDEQQRLPLAAFKSPGFLAANSAARDAFTDVVLFPGHVFIAPGRYRDIYNLDRIFDVEPDTKSPDGLYLIPENYLVKGVAFDQAREEAKAR
jgi:hypothetical protein